MGATREQCGQHHEVRQREQPLLCLRASSFRSPGDHSQMAAPRKVVHVLHTNACQAGDFGVGKDLLTRLYGYQGNLTISAAFVS